MLVTLSKPLISTPQSRKASGTYRSGMFSGWPVRVEKETSWPNHSPDAFSAKVGGKDGDDWRSGWAIG